MLSRRAARISGFRSCASRDVEGGRGARCAGWSCPARSWARPSVLHQRGVAVRDRGAPSGAGRKSPGRRLGVSVTPRTGRTLMPTESDGRQRVPGRGAELLGLNHCGGWAKMRAIQAVHLCSTRGRGSIVFARPRLHLPVEAGLSACALSNVRVGPADCCGVTACHPTRLGREKACPGATPTFSRRLPMCVREGRPRRRWLTDRGLPGRYCRESNAEKSWPSEPFHLGEWRRD